MKDKVSLKDRLRDLYGKDGTKVALSSLISVFIGLVAGGLIILIVALADSDIGLKGGTEGLKLIFAGLFSKGRNDAGELVFGFNGINLGNLLFRATPIIMTGLSVAIAFKSGLFNIGAAGQYLVGTAATLVTALSVPTAVVPSFFVWLLAFFSGIIAGALWGMIPGILKAKLRINEVLSCIMTNWIAANGVTWFFENSSLRNGAESGKVGFIMKTTANGVATGKLGLDRIFSGSQVNGGIFIAIIFAVGVYIVMSKTTLGYELKACGLGKYAAEYAGIKSEKMIILSMAVAGGLSGGAAALYYLSGNTEFFWSTYQSLPSEGFNGIPVALLAANNPIGVIFTGLFMSMLNIAGQQLKNLTSYNEYITDIIIGIIVYLSAFSLVIKGMITNFLTRKKEKSATVSAVRENTDSSDEIIKELNKKADIQEDG